MISILNQILNTLSLSKKIKKLVLGKSKGEKVIIIRTTNIVENKCKDLRLMLSWRFKPEYSWEESIEICKQYNLL